MILSTIEVETQTGFKQISSIRRTDSVYTPNGFTNVFRYKNSRYRTILIFLSFDNGSKLIATHLHQLFKPDMTCINACKVTVGMQLLARNTPLTVKEVKTIFIFERYTNIYVNSDLGIYYIRGGLAVGKN